MSKSKATEWIQTAFRLGLLVRMELKSSSLRFIYYFNPNPIPVIRSEGMSCSQRRILTILYSSFKDHYFTVQEAASVCCLKKEAFKAYLNSFAQRGIIVVNKQSGRFGHYAITTTPLEHPECFELEKASHSSPSFAAPIPMAAASA